MAVPDQLTINGNVYVDQEWSAFGVAEFLVWDRVLSLTELTEAQSYLTTKYGLIMAAPPLPPSPPPNAPPAPCNPQLVPTNPVFFAATTMAGPWTPYIRWFPDQTADFIWNTPNAAVSAAANINIYYYSTVQVAAPLLSLALSLADHAEHCLAAAAHTAAAAARLRCARRRRCGVRAALKHQSAVRCCAAARTPQRGPRVRV